MIEAIELAVGDGPIGEQRRVTAAAGLKQGRLALDVEEGLLLASEAGIGQVFSGGAGAHRYRWQNAIWCCQLSIGSQDCSAQIGRQAGVQQQGPGGLASGLQSGEVFCIKPRQQGPQRTVEAIGAQQVAVSTCRSGKAPRHPHALLCQLPDHLPEGGVLAAHGGYGLDAHLVEGQHQGFSRKHATRAAKPNSGACPPCQPAETGARMYWTILLRSAFCDPLIPGLDRCFHPWRNRPAWSNSPAWRTCPGPVGSGCSQASVN